MTISVYSHIFFIEQYFDSVRSIIRLKNDQIFEYAKFWTFFCTCENLIRFLMNLQYTESNEILLNKKYMLIYWNCHKWEVSTQNKL